MKKFYEHIKALFLMLVFIVGSGTLSAQIESNNTGGGDASSSSTWDSGQTPWIFGGATTAVGSITIKSGDIVYFDGDPENYTNGTITIESGGTLIVYGNLTVTNFTYPGIGTFVGNLTANGRILCSYLSSDNEVTGAGELYIGGYSPTPVSSGITLVNGVRIWTGADDEDWENDANWDPDIAGATGVVISPVAAEQPEIQLGYTVSSFYMLTSDAELTIQPTGALTVEGVFSNQGGEVDIRSILQVYGTVTGGFIVEDYTGDGIVKIEQNIVSSDWHVISSPMGGIEMSTFAGSNNFKVWTNGDGSYDFAPYDEVNNEWGPFNVFPSTPSADMQVGEGYIARLNSATEFDFEGNSIFTGTMNLTLDSTNYGWNAVGNPYTSGISANALGGGTYSVLADNAGSLYSEYLGVYMWDASMDDYYIVRLTDEEVRIPVCQGFLVRANADGAPFKFTNGMQAHSNTTNIKSAEIPRSEIKLFVQAGDFRNSTKISFEEGSSLGFDKGYDAGKLKGNDNIALYSRLSDNSRKTDFGVQSLADVSYSTVSIPIGLDLPAGGETVFSLETSVGFPEGALVYLEDVELKTKTQLNVEDGKHMVTLPEVYGADRFKLVVENYVSNNTTTNIDVERPEGPEYKVYTRDRNIIIEGESNKDTKFSIYNIEGRLYYEGQAKTLNENEIDASAYPNGIYLLNIRNTKKGETQTHKVAITK